MDDRDTTSLPTPARRVATVGARARRWMTGSLAVVMASLAGAGHAATDRRGGLVRLSPYDVAETVQRIEQVARAHGLPVLARVDRSGRSQARCVVVLGSAEGGTPVCMAPAAVAPDVPLALHVEETADGRALVRLPAVDVAAAQDAEPSEWPDSVVDELAGLPQLLEEALLARAPSPPERRPGR